MMMLRVMHEPSELVGYHLHGNIQLDNAGRGLDVTQLTAIVKTTHII
jgi:hypothetical protein